MTVAELIQKLNEYPQDMRVLTLGYEGGYNDIGLNIDDIVFDVNSKDTWYYGPHETVRYTDADTSTKCLIIGRSK